jgi:hypothetical protein
MKVPNKSGNTTNMAQHLKRFHPVEYSSLNLKSGSSGHTGVKKTTQPTISGAFQTSQPYDRTCSRHRVITSAVTNFIVKDMQALSLVERDSFKKLLQVMDPRYTLPGRKYFSQTAVPSMYNSARERLKSELMSEMEYFALTSDLWSSRTSDPYMSLTVHYIDSKWNLKAWCLETHFTPEDHNAQNLAEAMKQLMENWDLKEEFFVCITTDSGSNYLAAADVNDWVRLQCFGHRLHTAIGEKLLRLCRKLHTCHNVVLLFQDSTMKDKRVDRVVRTSKSLVAAFSKSWKRKRDLAAAQEEMNLPKHQLVAESPTRWGSRFKMIKRILEQNKAITQVLGADKDTRRLIPSWQDIDVMESIEVVLGPLFDFTDSLSGEKYISVSLVKPVLRLFEEQQLCPADEDTPMSKELKQRIMTYLKEKYSPQAVNDLLDIATVCDPRFKLRYLNDEEAKQVKQRMVAEMTQMSATTTEPKEPPGTTSACSESDPPPEKKKKPSLGAFFKKTSHTDATLSPESELEAYLRSDEVDAEDDPMEWWRMNAKKYPGVASLAKKYLCIPATSSASERVFSTGGNVITPQRASLNPDKVNQLVFLAHNNFSD